MKPTGRERISEGAFTTGKPSTAATRSRKQSGCLVSQSKLKRKCGECRSEILRKTEYLRCLARVGENGSLRHEISNREALIRDSGSEEEYQSRRGRLEVIKRDRY